MRYHQKENRINQIKLTHAIRFYVIWTQIISTGREKHNTYRGSLQSDQLKVTDICVNRRACVTVLQLQTPMPTNTSKQAVAGRGADRTQCPNGTQMN